MSPGTPVFCRVEGCQRRAAASIVRDDLPGPIELCATHTEDFRINGAAWSITWSPGGSVPTSVVAAPAAPVGRNPSGPGYGSKGAATSGAPGWTRLLGRLPGRHRSGS